MKRIFANRGYSRGFTLVEMLVVLLIIGILASLISAAAVRAVKRGRVAKIGMEINQLSLALTNYKTQFGEYPPDFFGVGSSDSAVDTAAKDKVIRHLAMAFPRFVLSGSDTAQKWTDLANYIPGLNGLALDPAKALTAWLGGMKDAQGRPSGFSKNPANPFDNSPSRIGPFFQFDPSRIQNDMYYPPGVPAGSGKPYVYFRAEIGQGHPNEYYLETTFKTWPNPPAATQTKPYWDDRNNTWVNNNSFQILCCGLDGMFGEENVYPSGLRSAAAPTPPTVMGISDIPPPNHFYYLDDQTNFSSGTIGDNLP